MAAQPGRPPRIVAELGRPETPEETAARKAENSRKHRANQTTRNLLLALAASLGLVLFLVLVVVRPAGAPLKPVDYHAAASDAQGSISVKLADPTLPAGWTANSATVKVGDGKARTWRIGFLTPGRGYLGLEQGIAVTDAWLGALLPTARPTGTVTISGVKWTVYDQRASQPGGNYAYSLYAQSPDSRYLLHGTAPTREFTVLARALAQQDPLLSKGATSK